MSPRRSSRAHTSQPHPSVLQHINSSTSSTASSRGDRNARSQQKAQSARSSVSSRSLSSEEIDGSAKQRARKTRSSQDDSKNEKTSAIDDEVDEEAEEEVTRCICAKLEYPGLPVSVGNSSKGNFKEDPDSTNLDEDTTGWFIQCDSCKVWQHGGCVGIMDAAKSPDEYYCELCRKDLHKVTTTANGRKYSRYLPVRESSSPLSSPSPSTQDKLKNSRDNGASRINADNVSKGRRSTMNSRDAAYEEEQLRRAIEMSKKERGTASTGAATRKPKRSRSRSESEERNDEAKRQRTAASGSSSATSQSKNRHPDGDSEDEERAKTEKSKSTCGAVARNQRNKEIRDREAQREKEKADALGRRKGRGERRGGDECDPSPERVSRNTSFKGNTNNTSFSHSPLPDHLPPKASHKKTGRPPTRRGRIGRNQYTRDRDLPNSDPPLASISPTRSNNSHDADSGMPHLNGNTSNGNGYGDNNGLGKPSRPRYMNPNRTTMNDMKRRVAGILEFISVQQVEMAGLEAPSTTKSSTSSNSPPDPNSNSQNGGQQGGKTDLDLEKATSAALFDRIDEEAFGALSSVEMMEVLTRKLMKWQGEYGKWGDK